MTNSNDVSRALGAADGEADFVAWCDDRHGYCVWSQLSRGEYKMIAGPFVTSDEAYYAAWPNAQPPSTGGAK